MSEKKMSRAAKILGIISGIIMVLTVALCLWVLFDIISSFDPDSGHTLGNIGYIIVLIYGTVGSTASGIISLVGLFIGVAKKQRGSLILFGILVAVAILWLIFIFIFGPTMLPTLP